MNARHGLADAGGLLARLVTLRGIHPNEPTHDNREFPAMRARNGSRLERKMLLAGTDARAAVTARWIHGDGHSASLVRQAGTPEDPNIIAVVASGAGLGGEQAIVGFVPAPVADKLVACDLLQRAKVGVRQLKVDTHGRHSTAKVVVDLVASIKSRKLYGDRLATDPKS